MKNSVAERVSIETRYSWVVCAAVAYTNGIVFGWTFVASILVRELEHVYGSDPDVILKASWVVSVQSSISFGGSLFAAYFVRRYGARPVGYFGVLCGTLSLAISPFTGSIDWWFLTYSVLNGAACSCIYIVFCVVQPLYFDVHRGLNFGIVCLASGLASFIYPPIWDALRRSLDFRFTLLVISSFFASTAIAVTAMRPRNHETSRNNRFVELPPSNTTDSTSARSQSTEYEAYNDVDQIASSSGVDDPTIGRSDRERIIDSDEPEDAKVRVVGESLCRNLAKQFDAHLLRNGSFMLFIIAIALIGCGTGIPQTHLVSYTYLYYPHEKVNQLVSAIGATQAVAKLISAALVDRIPVRLSLYLIQLGPVCCMVVMLIMSYLTMSQVPFAYLYVAAAAYGIFEGPSIAPIYPFLCRVVPLSEIGSAVAYMRILMAIGGLIGPPIGGGIYTSTKSYAIAYQIATIPVLIGSLIMFLARNLRDQPESRQTRSTSTAQYEAAASRNDAPAQAAAVS